MGVVAALPPLQRKLLACSLVAGSLPAAPLPVRHPPRSDDGAVAVAAIDLRVLSWTNLVAFSLRRRPLYQDTTAAEAAPVSAALGDAWESVGDGSPVMPPLPSCRR